MCIDLPIYLAKTILGHDGMEKHGHRWNHRICYRGFTYAEGIMLAYLKASPASTMSLRGDYSPQYGITPIRRSLPNLYRTHILKRSIGVLTLEQGNTYHAVAICDSIIYDPRGNTYLLPEAKYQFVQHCLTLEPRANKFITSHDINTLMAIRGNNTSMRHGKGGQ